MGLGIRKLMDVRKENHYKTDKALQVSIASAPSKGKGGSERKGPVE